MAVVSLTNLGDFTAPQNPEVVQGTKTYTVQVEGEATSLWIYPEINWNGQLIVTDSRGTELVNQTLDYGNVFHWLSLPVTANESYTITLTDASVMELAFKNDAGECLPVTCESGALFDEQTQVPDTISYKNSMYFDEIYHGRTAYEHLHGMPVYETTHPPLGKMFIMLGIAVFGMTGFGWRVAGVLFGIALVPVLYLFVRRAPQNPEVVQGTKTYTVQVEGEATSLWIYPEINWNGQLIVTDSRGTELVNQTLDYGNVFHWLSLPVTANESYTITLTDASVMELAFKNDAGECLPVTCESGALFDEQTQVPDTISYKNSMYFDEIYHGRTAYEHLHGMPVYETTHPPLGKMFIMLGIAVFGMTGFGWRVAGVLFGIALVPVLYLFVRRLTRSPRWAGFAALLAGLDLMRYAQSRIATIDIYGTFFILLGAYFMLWYCQSVLEKGVDQSILARACWKRAWIKASCPWRWQAWPSGWARPASGPASTPEPGWRCCISVCCGPAGGRRSRTSARN